MSEELGRRNNDFTKVAGEDRSCLFDPELQRAFVAGITHRSQGRDGLDEIAVALGLFLGFSRLEEPCLRCLILARS